MEGISNGLSKPGAEPFEESSKAFPSIDTVTGTEQSEGKKKKKIVIFFVNIFRCWFVYAHTSVCFSVSPKYGLPWGPEEGTGAGVTGVCELLCVGARRQIWLLWKSCKCSSPQSHLPASKYPLYSLLETIICFESDVTDTQGGNNWGVS